MIRKAPLLCLLTCLLFHPQAIAADPRPNILFCIADDASPHFGCYGCNFVRTPHIDQLASQGLKFNRAYTPTAKCAPSRAAILTGRNPWQLEEAANHQSFFPAKFKVMTEAFAEAGMYVGAQGKFWGPGEAKTEAGAPRKFGLVSSGGNGQKEDGGEGFRTFLKQRPKDQPFFFWFGSTNPHRPYTLDAGLAAGKTTSQIDHVPAFLPDNDTVRRDLLDYATEVELFDAQVGSLLKVLDESGEAGNTLVVVTSDHGMPFPRVKGHNYEMSNHVPLVMRWPHRIASPGRSVDAFVSLIDIAPTFFAAVHVVPEKVGMASITGKALHPLFESATGETQPYAILGRERNDVWARPGSESGLGYPVRAIREGDWLYIENFEPERWPCGNVELGLLDTDASPSKKWVEEQSQSNAYWQFCFGKRPREELFNVRSDPDCVRNLATDKEQQTLKQQLRETLYAQLKSQQDPRILGQGGVFDQYPTAKKQGAKAKPNPKKQAAGKGASD